MIYLTLSGRYSPGHFLKKNLPKVSYQKNKISEYQHFERFSYEQVKNNRSFFDGFTEERFTEIDYFRQWVLYAETFVFKQL